MLGKAGRSIDLERPALGCRLITSRAASVGGPCRAGTGPSLKSVYGCPRKQTTPSENLDRIGGIRVSRRFVTFITPPRQPASDSLFSTGWICTIGYVGA